MAHFAELDLNNVVLRVVVIHNNELLDDSGQESEAKGIAFCASLFGGTWIQTSYNANFRKNYAGTGFTYDAQRDAFIAPQPFPSWILDEQTCKWLAPVSRPTDNKPYYWNEQTLSWGIMEIPQPYPSWVFSQETYRWNAPVAYPSDGKRYAWNESLLSWQEVDLTQSE